MDWWSVFYKVRRTIFGFIAIASLLWGIYLSIYLARMWEHLLLAHRIVILAIIGANGFTALLLYLMAVVVFRVWMDLARVIFLLLIHVASAVMFTLFGANFSCDTFNTKVACKHVDLAFVVGSWVMTGLLLGYIPYLLIMLRIPQPLAKVTANSLLVTPLMSRRSSTSSFGSVTSVTGLLRADTVTGINTTRTIPKKLFLADSALIGDMSPRSLSGGNYGAMGTPRGLPMPSSPVSIYPSTPKFASPSTPLRLHTGQMIAHGITHRQVPRAIEDPPVPNPFADSLSQYNTPAAGFSQPSFSINASRDLPTSSTFETYPLNAPSQPSTGFSRSSSTIPTRPASNARPLYSHHDGEWIYRGDSVKRNTILRPGVAAVSPVLRQLTATPLSIHSVAPSMHLYTYSQPLPAAVHARAGSDPIWRPQTAAPTTYIDPNAPLPNPFPMVGSADVRRFASVPSAQFYAGQGGTYRHARNESHLAGALGRTPPRAETAVMDREQWKQLVFTAATGRVM